MKSKVLITGANGMLADALLPLLKEHGYACVATDIAPEKDVFQLDIRDKAATGAFILAQKPKLVFHLAAETDVDKCQTQKEHAMLTNASGTEYVAQACAQLDIPMVYISTGAIFDGKKPSGYTEEDVPNPLNVYGLSKLKGEEAVKRHLKKYFIVRAGWMIGGYKKDKKFVWKIVQLLKTKNEIPVVTDKVGSPTFTVDFTRGILAILHSGKFGTYHCVNTGICNRFEIAQKIAEGIHRTNVILRPVTSEVFPLPAPRGYSEALLNHNLSLMGLDLMRPWQEALKEYLAGLPE